MAYYIQTCRDQLDQLICSYIIILIDNSTLGAIHLVISYEVITSTMMGLNISNYTACRSGSVPLLLAFFGCSAFDILHQKHTFYW